MKNKNNNKEMKINVKTETKFVYFFFTVELPEWLPLSWKQLSSNGRKFRVH